MYYMYVLKTLSICMYVPQGTDSFSVTRRVTLSLMLQLLTAISSECSDKDATQLKQLAHKLLVRPTEINLTFHTYIHTFIQSYIHPYVHAFIHNMYILPYAHTQYSCIHNIHNFYAFIKFIHTYIHS